MTLALQLLVFVAAIAGLVGYGFYRDKKEHPRPKSGQADDRQSSIYFPERNEDNGRHRGVAMSRLSELPFFLTTSNTGTHEAP